MFKAVIVEAKRSGVASVHEALADAGCVDIEVLSFDEAIQMFATRACVVDLVVVDLYEAHLPRLHRLSREHHTGPIVAICDEYLVEAVRVAGATESITRPIRQQEFVGRIRSALRLAKRERTMTDKFEALRKEKEDLERLACVDALTGIANRRHALSLLAAEWRRSSREHHPLGLVMIDLDCYHAYNEQYGHLGGDRCLQLVCEAMSGCLRRPADFLGRYGGEEFVAVLPNTDALGAKIVAERLCASVEQLAIPHAASQCAKVVTITAGFASLHVTSDLTMDRLISVADAALLRAKSLGRNRVEGDAPLVRPSRRVSAQRWQRFAPVVADPWFADRIPSFLAEAYAGARTIVEALREEDISAIQETMGKLRDGSNALGLSAIEALVADLEHAAGIVDMQTAREAADELVQYVTHVQVIYRRSEPAAKPRAATSQ